MEGGRQERRLSRAAVVRLFGVGGASLVVAYLPKPSGGTTARALVKQVDGSYAPGTIGSGTTDYAALANKSTLGTAASRPATDFDPAGAATSAVSALVGAAPAALGTIYELAAQLGNDESAVANLTTLVGQKSNVRVNGTPVDVFEVDTTAVTSGDIGAIPVALIDAKGDLLAGTANDPATRVPVGSDGQVLMADTGSMAGIKWVNAPVAGILATLADAKDKLIVATANDAVTRLAVGADGQTVVADAAQAARVKWANPAPSEFSPLSSPRWATWSPRPQPSRRMISRRCRRTVLAADSTTATA